MSSDWRAPVVMYRGGPRDGWAYYESEAQQSARAAKRMGHKHPYHPTGRFETHPLNQESVEIWEYRPRNPSRWVISAADHHRGGLR